MKREIVIPEDLSEITLAQSIKYEELVSRNLDPVNFNRRKISLFTGIPYRDTLKIKKSDFDRIINHIDAALNKEAEFKPRFFLHGVEYGFIPNLDDITIGEYADLTMYAADNIETMHNLMAILFRPIIKTEGDNYQIMPYQGTAEFAEVMKDMPLNCVNGALFFFIRLSSELQEATLKYLTQELLKETKLPTISRVSAGTQRLKGWLKTISQRLRKWKSSGCTSA